MRRGTGVSTFFPANFVLKTSAGHEDETEADNQYKHHLLLQQQPPIFPPQDFSGVAAFLGGKRPSISLSGMMYPSGCEQNDTTTKNNNNGNAELSDDEGSMASGDRNKKRRLNMQQVKTLEESFEKGNKLEPDRKVQLARALGLQPRQIAIWFQNRRARWKTKHLEKDYDVLKTQFDVVKAHNDALQAQNQNLQLQILALTSGRELEVTNVVATESFNLNKETTDQGSCSNRSENISDQINMVKLDMPRAGGPSNSARPSSSSNLSAAELLFHQNQQHKNVSEENFSNMFCGVDDQSGFWPWIDQQQSFN